jgi:haloalkane dehalogenase
VRRVENYEPWLETSSDVPKLLLTFDPGAIVSAPVLQWCREHVAAIEIDHIGPGIPFVQEDEGPAIGVAIAAWQQRRGLSSSPISS